LSIDKFNLADALDAVPEHWRPRIIGEVNGSKFQVAKFLHGAGAVPVTRGALD
jgi:hypothetical protein